MKKTVFIALILLISPAFAVHPGHPATTATGIETVINNDGSLDLSSTDLTVDTLTVTDPNTLTTAAGVSEAIAGKSNLLIIYPTDTGIQAKIDAFEASKSWAADEPGTILFMPGKYTDNLTFGSDYILVDASMPGVVFTGTLTKSGDPTDLYLYLWVHPVDGTNPGEPTLTNWEAV